MNGSVWEFSDRAVFRTVSRNTVELINELGYYGSAGTWVVRRGFISDGASIPRFFWSFVGHPFSGDYIESAILHDALCRSGMYSPKFADEVMAESMAAQKTPQETINSILLGLKLARLWRRKPPVDPRFDDYLVAVPASHRSARASYD